MGMGSLPLSDTLRGKDGEVVEGEEEGEKEEEEKGEEVDVGVGIANLVWLQKPAIVCDRYGFLFFPSSSKTSCSCSCPSPLI
jgi:hypothetical protein